MRAWLAPWQWLDTCWQAWSNKPLPAALAALLHALAVGNGLQLYLRE